MPNIVDGDQADASTISWGAVIAGAIASAAVTLLLLAFGVGVGFSVVSPWAGEGVSATTFHVGAGLYLVAVAMLASTVGGYLTGRMRRRWIGLHDDVVYFRDTAHGLAVWALATVLGASVLATAATNIVGGAASRLAPAAATAAAHPTDGYVDMLLRAEPARANPATMPAADLAMTRAELGRLLAPTLRQGGDLAAPERTYVIKVVAARTGLPQAEAEKRVNDVVTQAKKAADDTRKATAKLMLWLAASMLAGALAAMLGALEGGLLRDHKWHEPGWRATVTRAHD
jgi:hypothetical protein